MKYLCLVYTDGHVVTDLGPRDKYTLDITSMAHNENLARSGNLIAAQALQPPDEAVTLRVRNGQLSMTDGPFAETREHLGGFVFIDARDEAEALAIAADIPLARLGAIEVRAVMDVVPVPP